jgi:hypothetical protein
VPPIPVPPTPLTTPRTPLPSAEGKTPLQGGGSSSLTGWNHLTREWAETLPSALHTAANVRRAALRLLGSGRKVAR